MSWALLKRIVVLCLALTFVGTATAEIVGQAMAGPPCTMQMDNAGAQGDMPCKGMMPTCVNDVCVFAALDVPEVPVLTEQQVVLIVRYSISDDVASGRVIEPEHTPPILRA